MNPTLFEYGFFSIHIYGVCVATSVGLFYVLLSRDTKTKKLISNAQLSALTTWSIIAGAIGGRLLFIAEYAHEFPSWYSYIQLTTAGFSITGTIGSLLLFIPFYLRYQKIEVLPLLDRITLYAPLSMAVARLGCFFAGCCYGKPTSLWWGIRYLNPASLAPTGVMLHPTQLYSATLLLMLFTVQYIKLQHTYKKPGQLFAFFLISANLQRYVIDFFRSDSIPVFSIYSFSQITALIGCTIGYILKMFTSTKPRRCHEYFHSHKN